MKIKFSVFHKEKLHLKTALLFKKNKQTLELDIKWIY